MSSDVNIVIPMAGRGERFKRAGFDVPKPLIDVCGRPMINWVLASFEPKRHTIGTIYLIVHESIIGYPRIAALAADPKFKIISVQAVTEGPAATIALAHRYIDNDAPLVIANCDQYISADLDDFLDMTLRHDGAVMTFPSHGNIDCSYCHVVDGRILSIREREIISDLGNTGVFAFRQGRDYVLFAEEIRKRKLTTHGEQYVSLIIDHAAASGADIRSFPLAHDEFFVLGTPSQLSLFVDYRNSSPKDSSNAESV